MRVGTSALLLALCVTPFAAAGSVPPAPILGEIYAVEEMVSDYDIACLVSERPQSGTPVGGIVERLGEAGAKAEEAVDCVLRIGHQCQIWMWDVHRAVGEVERSIEGLSLSLLIP